MSGNHTSLVRKRFIAAVLWTTWRRSDQIGQGRACAVCDFSKKERRQTGRLCVHGTDRH
jgi:hypothetical protein